MSDVTDHRQRSAQSAERPSLQLLAQLRRRPCGEADIGLSWGAGSILACEVLSGVSAIYKVTIIWIWCRDDSPRATNARAGWLACCHSLARCNSHCLLRLRGRTCPLGCHAGPPAPISSSSRQSGTRGRVNFQRTSSTGGSFPDS